MRLRLLLLLGAAGAAGIAVRRRRAAAALTQGNATTPSPPGPVPSNYDRGPGGAEPDTSGARGVTGRPASDAAPSKAPRSTLTEDVTSAGSPGDTAGAAATEEHARSIEALVAEQEAAAAAEAAAIGGRGSGDGHGDPAMEAVYEGGGGEAEGFEAAQELLIENATHGAGHARPHTDAFTPEREADRARGEYGEADHERSSQGRDRET